MLKVPREIVCRASWRGGRLRCNPWRRDRFPLPEAAANRPSHAQLRHLSGEFAERLVDRFCKFLRILFRITA